MADDNLVLTPGGYRDRSLVHHIPPGHVLDFADGRMVMTDLKTNISQEIPPSEAKGPTLGDGWISFTSWRNTASTPLTQFTSGWQVPQAPTTQNGQTIFLFNAIQPPPGNAILQPVLQWGSSAAGGGPYWSLASWYLGGSGHNFHTDLVRVDVDTVLLGVMNLTGRNENLFNYDCQFSGYTATRLSITNVAQLTDCFETLEAYTVSECGDYPASPSTQFFFIQVDSGNLGQSPE